MTNYMIHYIILSDYGTSYALIILCLKNIELIVWITSLFCGFLFLSLICVPWQTRGLVLPFAGLLQSTSVFWFFYVLGFPIYFEMLNCRCPGFHSSWHARYLGYVLWRIWTYDCKYMIQLLHLLWFCILRTELSCSFPHHFCPHKTFSQELDHYWDWYELW
jgi:hypothetical protein